MKNLLLLLVLITLSACQPTTTPTTEKSVAADVAGFDIYDIPGTDAQRAVKIAEDQSVAEEGLIENGRKEGTWITYHPQSPFPKTLYNFKDGLANGVYMEFSERGQVMMMAHYKNNKLDGKWAKYRFGRPTFEATYKDGELHGVYTEYYTNTEKIQKQVTYKNGVMDGLTRFFKEDGTVSVEFMYKNGEKQGGGIKNPGVDNSPR